MDRLVISDYGSMRAMVPKSWLQAINAANAIGIAIRIDHASCITLVVEEELGASLRIVGSRADAPKQLRLWSGLQFTFSKVSLSDCRRRGGCLCGEEGCIRAIPKPSNA